MKYPGKIIKLQLIRAIDRRDFLEENYITTSADWFLRPEGETEVKPQGDCYSWIDKTVQRKK